MTFRGIDYCLRCGRQLRASRLPFIGDCCAKKVTAGQLEAMRAYAEAVADPFHIPEPRPLSPEGRMNNRNARAAAAGTAQLCTRHENPIGRCPQCAWEAEAENASKRILREVLAQPHTARRADRIAVQDARRAAGLPAPVARPARRPSLRDHPARPKVRAAHPATGQMELL